jgi:triosephosphate isomerase (TIM)
VDLVATLKFLGKREEAFMKNQYIFVGNWKMQLNFDETVQFASEYYDDFVSLADEHSIVLCPEAISLYPMTQMFKATNVEIGAQNCSEHVVGAFTGDISAMSVHNVGCKYCIVGHSERRQNNHESDEKIARKIEHLLDYKVSPIICIGETKKDLDAKKVFEVLKKQLTPVLEKISQNSLIADYLPICIAYEPIWSIGTGDVPSVEHLDTVFAFIKDLVQKTSIKLNWRLLYGGSVNKENIEELKKINGLNGFLIGNSSLDFQEFKKIVHLGSSK